MRFADLKNDFLFRRIFARHPELTSALLNDLLSLEGRSRIAQLELLPAEQAPEVPAFKLSVVDVKCRDQSGRVFVVEMQLAHFTGFLHRTVFNASKAFIRQLPQGGTYSELSDVIALSVCSFALWPDALRDAQGLPRVPLVSRWRLAEQKSGATDGLGQIQYAFVELPKVPLDRPLSTPAEQWAWMFRVGEHEGSIPAAASEAQKRVLELSNEATFTEPEREAYRKMQDEIAAALQMARDAECRGRAEGLRDGRAEGLRDGRAEGLRDGRAEGLREAIVDLCEACGIALDDARRNHLAGLDLPGLEALRQQLKQQKAWP